MYVAKNAKEYLSKSLRFSYSEIKSPVALSMGLFEYLFCRKMELIGFDFIA